MSLSIHAGKHRVKPFVKIILRAGKNDGKHIPMTKKEALALIGKAGGKARAKKLSPARRLEIAQRAARARWDRRPPPTDELG